MSTKRKDIIDALVLLLEGIDGMAGQVGAWQLPRLASDSLPYIVLRDGSVSVSTEAITIGAMQHRMDLQVACICSGADAIDSARELGQSALAAIMADPQLGGICFWIDLNGHNLEAEQAEKIQAVLTLDFSVVYETDRMHL